MTVFIICILVVAVGVLSYCLVRTCKRLKREMRVNQTMNDGIYRLLKVTGNSMKMLDDEHYELITRVKRVEESLRDMEEQERPGPVQETAGKREEKAKGNKGLMGLRCVCVHVFSRRRSSAHRPV